MVLLYLIKDSLYKVNMVFFIQISQNIVDINNDKYVKFFSKNCVDITLNICQSVK